MAGEQIENDNNNNNKAIKNKFRCLNNNNNDLILYKIYKF